MFAGYGGFVVCCP